MIKEDKKWIIDYNFQKKGIYQFEIVFNNIINNMNRFFEKCSNIISLDFSNFNSSNVTDMFCMFDECKRLKLDTTKIDEIISSNKNIKDQIDGIKFNIDNIIIVRLF